MDKYVVAVAMDKVQSFLYDVLQAQIQQKQTNSGTLKQIMGSSRFISEKFYEDIGLVGEHGKFKGEIDEELLKCSGMCVFITSLSEQEIVSRLKALFEMYYIKMSGKLFVKYVYFKQTDVSTNKQYQLEAIHESKHRLRRKECIHSIVEQNQELIFRFQCSPKENPFDFPTSDEAKPSIFTNTINALYSKQEGDNDNRFRVAIIKADLDGMGARFKQIKSYKVYKQVSEWLSEYISIDYLSYRAKRYKERDPAFRLFPLYVAGDDIFFAVPTSKLLDGVNLAIDILKRINAKLQEINESFGAGEASEVQLHPLSMSVGIEFAFNREPIRYYYERVQKQLDHAKKEQGVKSFAGLSPSSCVKISINEHVLHRYELDQAVAGEAQQISDKAHAKRLAEFKEKNADKQQWSHFVSQVKRLQTAMGNGFAAHHFFYGLLQKITDPNICKSQIKYSNAVLYHVIPQYLNSKALRESELLVIEPVLKQLMVKTTDRGKPSKEARLSFDMEQQKRLEKYVRLLLLFSDPRFKIMQPKDSDRTDQKKQPDFDIKRVRSTVFNKTLRYLYENNLGGWTKRNLFRDVFVQESSYSLFENSKRPTQVQVYRTLPLSSSMMHRFKKIGDLDQIAKMIEGTHVKSREEIKQLEVDLKQEHKAPPGLYFNKETFLRLARSSQMWNPDYVDSLIIFYQLREQLIQFRTRPAHVKKRFNARPKPHTGKKNNSKGGKQNDRS
ncbi:hypothetical protein NKT34_29425 [Paenibacillus polysaccharolyticus]|uniref:Cas10/Cmr2 second palm domain-containing protein n=1 Tax=Paenibacillus polysaccharolyticus TaxID=582692 RepID=UPI00209DE679|nr:hypothetical protein [Paenibacillus polysaccharolyticus]MCP1137380.1 hypothetical protein [Paenibacillus polysaccharolyticus]